MGTKCQSSLPGPRGGEEKRSRGVLTYSPGGCLSLTKTGHWTLATPSCRDENPSPMSNRSMAYMSGGHHWLTRTITSQMPTAYFRKVQQTVWVIAGEELLSLFSRTQLKITFKKPLYYAALDLLMCPVDLLHDLTCLSRYLSISKSGQKSGGVSGCLLLWPNLMAHSGPLR